MICFSICTTSLMCGNVDGTSQKQRTLGTIAPFSPSFCLLIYLFYLCHAWPEDSLAAFKWVQGALVNICVWMAYLHLKDFKSFSFCSTHVRWGFFNYGYFCPCGLWISLKINLFNLLKANYETLNTCIIGEFCLFFPPELSSTKCHFHPGFLQLTKKCKKK